MKVLPDTVSQLWNNSTFQSDYVSLALSEAQTSPDAYLQHITALSNADSKAPHLKKLQGRLWRTGYENGDIVTPLFPDVVSVLKRWRTEEGKRLAIFSSGSVQAQRMFFGHVGYDAEGKGEGETEDLNPLFDANFDTINAGPKTERQSYEVIAKELGMKPERILFLSDNVKEIRAAKEAGMWAVVVDRPGNAPLSNENKSEFQVVESLAEINFT